MRQSRVSPRAPTADAIREAAIDVFFRLGYGSATVRGIARPLGISAATIYNHYSSKQAILFEIMHDTNECLLQGLKVELADAHGPSERIRRTIAYHVLFHASHHREAFLADSELRSLEPKNREVVTAQRKAYEHYVQQILTDGHRSGAFAIDDVTLTSYAIITACSAVGAWYRKDGPRTLLEVAEIYANVLTRGIEPRQASYSPIPRSRRGDLRGTRNVPDGSP